jgi:hypothetical protein
MKDAMISIGARSWSFPGAQIDTDSWEVEWHSDGKVYLHDDTGAVIEGTEVDEPEDSSEVLVLSPAERRRREILLARLMLVAIDIVLGGDLLGLETGRDLLKEVEHTFPELAAERVEIE